MKGDFSRMTFRPDHHFSLVLLQQGRVVLDADFNEQGALLAHAIRQRTRDLLGPHAGPAGGSGFAIGVADGKFAIGNGRYYVDGLCAEHPAPAPDAGGAIPALLYRNQPGYPFPDSLPEDKLQANTVYFFYLDVWEAPVTPFEDPSIREVALGLADTAIRAQVLWQVKAVERPAGPFDPEAWLAEHRQRHSRVNPAAVGARLPQLQAWTDPKDRPDDTPCVADPLGGYSGLENQLYRIEIHTDGTQPGVPMTFKWSRENGSVAGAWVDRDGNDLIVDGIRDAARGFSPGQWIEVSDRVAQLQGRPGVMARLVKVDRGRLTIDPASLSAALPDLALLSSPIVRRWDHRASRDYQMHGGAIVLEEAKVYAIERGIKVSFRKAPVGDVVAYRTSDHWMIPARTATADIEWPSHVDALLATKVFEFREPDGIHHAYAPLALVTPKPAPTAPDITTLQRTIIQLWA